MLCGFGDQDFPQGKPNIRIDKYVYDMRRPIGKGNFSQVFRGVDERTGRVVGIKVIKSSSLKSGVAKKLLKNEIQILQRLNHPNTLQCYDIFTTSDSHYIVTEFCEGGDLEQHLHKHSKMNEHEIARLIYDVFQGLLYLNTMGIVHRDIKVANVFIDQNGTAKIADFGFAITGTQPFKDINIGSPIYMTPESLLLREYGPKTDVWAFGVFVYELLHGDTPLGQCSSEQELKERVLLPPKILPSLSEEVQHFIKLCLTLNPRYRPTIRDLTTTPYYQRLLHELECKSTNEMNTTMSSVQPDRALMLVEKISTYDEAMAILNYCRLIHKATEIQPSSILSQWLLSMCAELPKVNFTGDTLKDLKKVMSDYYRRYQREHKSSNMQYWLDDIAQQCQRVINDRQCNGQNYYQLLLKETQLLQKYSKRNKLSYYAQHSEVQEFLEARGRRYSYYRS